MRSWVRVLVILAALWVATSAFALAAEKPPGSVLATIPLETRTPTGLAWDGSRLWVADYDSAVLQAIDPATGKVVASLPAPGYAPMGLAWDGERLWCLDADDKTAYALDVARKRTVRALPLDSPTPEGLGWDGTALWVADAGAGLMMRLDQQDGTTYRSFPSPTAHSGKRVQEMGIAWDGKWLWVSDRGSDRIYQVDPKTGWVINFFDSPAPYPTGLAWDGRRLWCADYETHTLYAVAARSAASFVTYQPKRERVVYAEQWRNFGPGTATTLDIYLAVPQDLPNQTLAGEPVFEPKPTDFPTDQWGQRFAHFAVRDLAAGREFVARMTTDVTVKRVRWFVDPDAVGGLDQVPPAIRKAYLVDESKLVMSDPVIQNAVREAVGDEKRPYWIAQRIYHYIMRRMHYELVGGWNVAPVVLERGSGSCSEYSFVMISMCRAAGLPARYAGSIVVRGDDASRDDVFHRWVEVYLPHYGWVCVDPSGGDSEVPEDQAKYFGGLDNRFLITTLGGGNSTYLGWDYNSNALWTGEGKVKLMQRKAGEWFPVGKKYEPPAVGTPGGTTGE
jgi:transglutaminase-like putative cysteine protease